MSYRSVYISYMWRFPPTSFYVRYVSYVKNYVKRYGKLRNLRNTLDGKLPVTYVNPGMSVSYMISIMWRGNLRKLHMVFYVSC